MAKKITEKEILRVQYGNEECLAEVPELNMKFAAPTIGEVIRMALDAIKQNSEGFCPNEQNQRRDTLDKTLKRIKADAKELQSRKEEIEAKIESLIVVDGLKAKEILEESRLLEWALGKLTPGHPMQIQSVAFRWYADLDQDGDIDCCAVFYKSKRIKKTGTIRDINYHSSESSNS